MTATTPPTIANAFDRRARGRGEGAGAGVGGAERAMPTTGPKTLWGHRHRDVTFAVGSMSSPSRPRTATLGTPGPSHTIRAQSVQELLAAAAARGTHSPTSDSPHSIGPSRSPGPRTLGEASYVHLHTQFEKCPRRILLRQGSEMRPSAFVRPGGLCGG